VIMMAFTIQEAFTEFKRCLPVWKLVKKPGSP